MHADLVAPAAVRRSTALRVGPAIAAASAIDALVGAVTISVFFAVGEPWGTINDWSSLALSILFIGLALVVRSVLAASRPVGGPDRSWPIAGVGIAGGAIASVGTIALLARIGTFEQTLPSVLSGYALTGLWLVAIGIDGRAQFGRAISGASVVAGIGYVAVSIASSVLSTQDVVVSLVGAVAVIGHLSWALLLARRLGRLGTPA